MTTAHVEAIVVAIVGTVFIPIAWASRKRGVRGWQGFALGVVLCYVIAVMAAFGVVFGGRT